MLSESDVVLMYRGESLLHNCHPISFSFIILITYSYCPFYVVVLAHLICSCLMLPGLSIAPVSLCISQKSLVSFLTNDYISSSLSIMIWSVMLVCILWFGFHIISVIVNSCHAVLGGNWVLCVMLSLIIPLVYLGGF